MHGDDDEWLGGESLHDFGAAEVGRWEWRIDTGDFSFNRRWARLVGRTLQDLSPLSFEARLRLIHPDDRERSSELLDRHLASADSPYECELRFVRPDGQHVWVWEQGAVSERNGEGRPRRMAATCLDITERKRTEQALQESQRALRTILDNTHDAIFIHAVDGRILDVNDKMLEVYQVTRDQALAASIADDFSMPESPRHELEEIWQRVLSGEAVSFEWKAKRPNDGSGFDVEVALKRIVLNDERVVLANVRDITERKTAEALIRLSEQNFRVLVEHSHDSIARWDRKHRCRYANPILAAQLGIPMEHFVGKTLRELGLPEDYRAFWYDAVEKVFRSGKVNRFEYQMPDHKWMDCIVMPELDGSGHVRTAIVSARDITDKKNAEAEKSKLEAQLRQSQKMEAVGRLAGGVAHDFNNMLGVILGSSELALLDQKLRDNTREHFTNIQTAARRSGELTRQLLAFARRQTIDPKVLDLNETVGTMLPMLRRLIGEDIELAWLPTDAPWPVMADRSQIHQILANLCVNARDAIVGVGKVTIETNNATFDAAYCADHAGFVPGDFLMLAVSDNGVGMDRETLQNLFEPFFTTKSPGEGTGLGLAMVYGIVKQSDGFVNVYSEVGKGSTFRIYLPRHEGERPSTRSKALRHALRHGNETILLVEDQPQLLEIAVAMLERLGYHVLPASTPSEALRLAQSLAQSQGHSIHLLLTDVIMPEMDGRDLSTRIEAIHPNIKCLFMSGYTANVIAHHGVLDEGVSFIPKPFSIWDLGTKLRQVLDGD